MKRILIISAIFISIQTFGQKHTPLPHGMVFGTKPALSAAVNGTALETYMGKKTRITTTITGTVLKVTKPHGGWFDLDAGKGRIIAAHFRNYNITLPTNLKGRTVIVEGVAAKQFIADDLQHLAGDTVIGKKQHRIKTNPKQKLTFEVKGLMVDH